MRPPTRAVDAARAAAAATATFAARAVAAATATFAALVAFAAIVTLSAVLVPPAHAAAAARGAWVKPVAGGVTRGFALGPDPFAGGQHRGADFAAARGTAVGAACAGRVLVAGRVGSSGRVVTIRCGRWRVSHLPLDVVAVRAGAIVGRGDRIGTVAGGRSHDGLHVGVRRDGRRFAYVDPLRFFPPEPPPAPVVRHPPASRRLPAPPTRARPAGSSPVAAGARPWATGVAPWPAWLGLGLLLAGAVGAGVRRGPRRRRASLPHTAAQEVR